MFQIPETLWTCWAKSTILFEYPHSLSYQDTTLWKLLFSEIPACESNTDECESCKMSDDTI
jgi:hypothetical protein